MKQHIYSRWGLRVSFHPLNVMRLAFFSIYDLLFSHSLNIGIMRVRSGPNPSYLFWFMSFCTNGFVVLILFLLKCTEQRSIRKGARDFFLFKYLLNNLLLIIFMRNMLSKLVESLLVNHCQKKQRTPSWVTVC